MYNMEDGRRKRIFEMVSIVKLISFLFCGIIIMGIYPIFEKMDAKIKDHNFNTLMIGIISIFVIMLIYEAWIFTIRKHKSYEGIKITDIIETCFFMSMFAIIIMLSGVHISQYKFLFLFIIITATMQFGRNYGLITAAMSTGFVLMIDLIAVSNSEVNIYFETDLIIAGIFILTAWLVGSYVNIEEEYREKLESLAIVDELTGVYNHRFFHDAITQQIEESEKSVSPLSLLFIDIDYFKNYNDLYGHQAGDKVLKTIGGLLKTTARKKDIIARYGGEEFAVIMGNTLEGDAIQQAETIRKNVEEFYFDGEENLPNKKLTISIGVSTFPDKAKSKMELINSADDALYRAKFFNKNRVEKYHSILEELKMDIETEHIDLISSIKTLISIINAKDRYTYAHTERVVIYCDLMGKKLGLTEEQRKTLRYGAYMHDIGKIQIPEEVLNKKMPLTDEEWQVLVKHPSHGADILKSVEALKSVIPLILYHHERYDGRGYPEGLRGEEIPYLTRILTIADSFDAMTSNRPYRNSKNYDEAIIELQKHKGSQFDSDLIIDFIEMVQDHRNNFDIYK